MKNFIVTILIWCLIASNSAFATLASATNRNDFIGNGAANEFSYTFKIFANTHLLVTVQDLDDTEATLVLTTDYTVAGVGDASGGVVTLVDSGQPHLDAEGDLLTDFKLTIRRNVPLTQDTDIRNQGVYFPAAIEDQFDLLMMTDQQQQDQLDRSLKLPETIAGSAFQTILELPLTANFILGVNAGGDKFEVKPASTFAFDDSAPTTTKGDIIVQDGDDNVRFAIGTERQVLSVEAGELQSLKWKTMSMNDVTPTTTKGDLITDDGTNAIRLAVGADGQVLKADSGQTSGLIWDAEGIRTVSIVTASYEATVADKALIFDTSIAPVLTLFTAVGNVGRTLFIKNLSIGIVTISLPLIETLDGETSQELHQFDGVEIISDGINWNAF